MNIQLPIELLVSILNTKLRDYYDSLDALCEEEEIIKEELLLKLDQNNYYYNMDLNQIKVK